jgi:hypothetical protein
MEDRELIERIERHMAESSRYMGRGIELMDEVRAEMRRNRESTERLFARQERFLSEQVSVLGRLVAVIDRIGGDMRDLRQAGNEHSQALLRMIDRMDRLDPGGSAAGA